MVIAEVPTRPPKPPLHGLFVPVHVSLTLPTHAPRAGSVEGSSEPL